MNPNYENAKNKGSETMNNLASNPQGKHKGFELPTTERPKYKQSSHNVEMPDTFRNGSTEYGAIYGAANSMAHNLDEAGSYLMDMDLSTLGKDLLSSLRRHPVSALIGGVAVGYLLIRFLKRN